MIHVEAGSWVKLLKEFVTDRMYPDRQDMHNLRPQKTATKQLIS